MTGENKKEELFGLVCKGKDKWKYVSMYITFIPFERKERKFKVMDKSVIWEVLKVQLYNFMFFN